MSAVCKTQAVYEGGRIVLLARIEKSNAAAATQSDVYSINLKCYDIEDPANAIVSVDLTIGDVIFNTLQTGNGWTLDSATNPDPVSGLSGWNFKYVTTNAFFPRGNRKYAVEAELVSVAVPQDDDAPKDYQSWEVPTLNLFRR
jgi:hypothetical protein